MNKYLVFALLFVWSTFTQATPITTAFGPFQFLDNRSSNDAGFVAGVAMQYGVVSVTPNGSNGTTGTAVNGPYSRTVNPLPFSAAPNFFSGNLPCPNGICDPIAFNPWQITLSNGTDTRIVNTPGVSPSFQSNIMPFVSNVLINTSTAQPTISWQLPTAAFDAVVVRIRDNTNPVNGIADLIYQEYYAANTSQVSLNTNWYNPANQYSIEIDLADLRNTFISGVENSGSRMGIMFADTQNQSRAFFNYSVLSPGAPAEVYLPTPSLQPDGSLAYNFNIQNVAPNQTYFIDPLVAIGYDYAVGAGDPLFASVLLPVGIGDDLYEIILNNVPYMAQGGVLFDFLTLFSDGIDSFRVLGIETSAGLDPGNPTAFITGLQFVGQGNFTGSMTPITVQVPEPASLVLLMGGLGVLLGFRRKCPGKQML